MKPPVPDPAWWSARRVFITGHTGFVGGWLASWLATLGARVDGFSLEPPSQPSFFEVARLASRIASSTHGDIRDPGALRAAMRKADPQVVFHLAAQPIVRAAFHDPAVTFATNVMGTVNVLEACRDCGVQRIVAFTTDKVYLNDDSRRAFVETDALGGREPYGASKVGAEWAIEAYGSSYFRRGEKRCALAAVRAGNIVGGGDWGVDRLVPDAARAFAAGIPLKLRNPGATRPWQHVLDAVRGALVLAEHLDPAQSEAGPPAWNFGPPADVVHSVADVATLAAKAWGDSASWVREDDGSIPESRSLAISSAKAAQRLGWRTRWDIERAIAESVAWYKAAARGAGDLVELTSRQIDAHVKDAVS